MPLYIHPSPSLSVIRINFSDLYVFPGIINGLRPERITKQIFQCKNVITLAVKRADNIYLAAEDAEEAQDLADIHKIKQHHNSGGIVVWTTIGSEFSQLSWQCPALYKTYQDLFQYIGGDQL